MVKPSRKSMTLEAFLELPEAKPASEYIDGQIIQKPIPQGKHSVIQGEFAANANVRLKPSQVARAFPELRCTFGGRSTVPDVAVFVGSRIVRDDNGEIANPFELAPDWTIEVLSPGQSQTKVTRNILHCLQHGCLMGWLIDPEEKSVIVFWPDRSTAIFDEPEQALPVPTFAEAFQFMVGELFDWLK